MIILSGVSGVGKSHFSLLLERSLGFSVVPSLTTREPRSGEIGSKDRHFCSESNFHKRAEQGTIVFPKQVFGSWYAFDLNGIPEEKAVFQLRYFYCEEFRSLFPQAKAIYIMPAQPEQAVKKILSRKRGEGELDTQTRIQEIERELADVRAGKYDFDAIWVNSYSNKSEKEFISLVSMLCPQGT